jgi:Flp pilus assembly protein TadD
LAPAGDQKLKFMTQAVRLDPNFSQANFQMGRLQFERKNFRSAADHLLKVAQSDVRYRESRFLLGLSKYRSGDFAAAEQAFRSVVEAVPLNEVWNNLGAAQSRMDSPNAVASFQKALEGDPADPDYHFNAGYALFRKGEYIAAAERFRAVLERNPNDVEATTLLGRCLKPATPQRGAKSEGLERLKENFEESAYLQLKAVLEPKQ